MTSLLKGTSIVGGLTLLSRILGFVRDLVIALLFGTSRFSDAFFVAFRIPNLLRSVFAEGALTSAFVPTIAEEAEKSERHVADAFRAIAGMLFTATGIVTLLGVLFAPYVVTAIAPGFRANEETYYLCIKLTRVVMPYLICVSIVALINGTLNTYLVFGASAIAQVAMNLVLIAGAALALLVPLKEDAALLLAVFVLVGGSVQIVAQFPALRRLNLLLSPRLSFRHPAVLATARLMLPAIGGAAVYQLTIFMLTLFASLLQEGSVSWLFYADRLTQLPIGVFSVALASVLLPILSRAHASKDKSQVRRHLINSLRYTSLLLVPASVFLFLEAERIVSFLFERGEFNSRSSLQTSYAVKALALGIWGVSCASLMNRAFFSRKDTVTPLLSGALTLSVTLVGVLFFMGPPERGEESLVGLLLLTGQKALPLRWDLNHAGLGLSSSLAATVSLLFLLTRYSFVVGSFQFRPFLTSTTRAVVASGACLLAAKYLPSPHFLVSACYFAATYPATLLLLRSPELREIFCGARSLLSSQSKQ